MFDLIIKNGTIIDGTGRERFVGDIAVKDGKIIEIGDLSNYESKEDIDAEGLIISPGFIDSHSHSDLFSLSMPFPANKIRQGITTEVVGHCGLSPYPFKKEATGNVNRYLGFGMMDKIVDEEYNDVEKYFTKLRDKGLGYNYIALVGHGTLRASVVGLGNNSPTDDEMDEMKELLDTAMKQGAIGMSTGLGYLPGCFSTTEELIELSKVVAKYNGIYATHLRNQNKYLIESVKEAIEIGEKSGAKVIISHLKAFGRENWGKVEEAIKLIKEARDRSVDVICDFYPYIASETTITSILPDWANEGGIRKMLTRLMDEEAKQRIIKEMSARKIEFDNIIISNLREEKNKKFIGKDLENISEILNKSPYEALFQLLIEEKGFIMSVNKGMCDEDIRTLVNFDYALLGSDAMPYAEDYPVDYCHPRNYGTFPKFIRKYVKEEKLISLEESIRRMTKSTADFYCIPNRGSIEVGNFGDFVIFNFDELQDNATIKEPMLNNEGIKYVILGGTIQLEHGNYKKEKVGNVLTRQ